MAVQAGIWNFDNRPVERESLSAMSQAMAEYGPDGEASYLDGSLGMLHRQFHTTAESRREQQPHHFGNGNVITWDGRLDNRLELLSELHSSAGCTDVDLVAAAFDCWGTNCLARIVGDWALSIWIPARKELILARDYLGVRPLFYYIKPNRILWCSQLAPLVLGGDQFTVCDEYVAGYLAYYPAAHLTPYREIHAVPPGSWMSIRKGAAQVSRYWSVTSWKPIRHKTDAEYEDHFRYQFRQAVQRRLRADAPVLAELSGGLDSSSIVCMADDVIANGDAGTSRVDTISFYDPRVPMADERHFVAQVEKRRGRQGYHMDLSNPGADYFCLGSGQFLPQPGPSRHVHRARLHRLELLQDHGYRVAISGMGGDDFLGGGSDPLAQLADRIVLPQPFSLARALAAWSKVKQCSRLQLLLQAIQLLLPAALRTTFNPRAKVKPWIAAQFAKQHHFARRQLGPLGRHGFWLPSRQELAQRLVVIRRQLALSQPILMRCEERTYPFLDRDLVNFLCSIPAAQLLRPGQERSLMRRALVDIVPAEVLGRTTKGGGSIDFSVSFQRNQGVLEGWLINSLSGRKGYLDEACFRNKLQTSISRDPGKVVYKAKDLFLEVWLRNMVEHRVISAAGERPLTTEVKHLKKGILMRENLS